MVIGIFGESCTGKSTLAEAISACIPCEVITGKDYLRLAKNENMAKALFRKKLDAAMDGAHIIYVIAEKEHLALLPEVGEFVEFGGLLGRAPIMPVNSSDCTNFVNRGGRIPAPVHSMKN